MFVSGRARSCRAKTRETAGWKRGLGVIHRCAKPCGYLRRVGIRCPPEEGAGSPGMEQNRSGRDRGDTTKLWITVRVVCRLSTMTALGAYAIVGKVFAGGTRETYVPAQEATQAEAPRISRADAHARWTKRVEAPEGKGTPPGFDLTPNAVSTAADGSRGIPPGLSRRHANRERADRNPRHLARARTGTRRHRRAAPDRGGCAAESSQAADPGGSRPNVRHAAGRGRHRHRAAQRGGRRAV